MANTLNNIATSLTSTTFQQMYETNPVLLTGGIAGTSGIPVPLGTLINAGGFVASGLSSLISGQGLQENTNTVIFKPLSGGTLIDNLPATFPTVDQQTAAYTSIVQPNRVAMQMIMPATTVGGYTAKTAISTLLTGLLTAHITNGGLFTILTPAWIYQNCILEKFIDQTSGGSLQVQWDWTLQFSQPLVQEGNTFNNIVGNIIGNLTSGIQNAVNYTSGLVNEVFG